MTSKLSEGQSQDNEIFVPSFRTLRMDGQQIVLGPKLMFAKRDNHYPRMSGQTSLATAVTNITKPITKINFGPSTIE